jgi:hypothetical protein
MGMVRWRFLVSNEAVSAFSSKENEMILGGEGVGENGERGVHASIVPHPTGKSVIRWREIFVFGDAW